jgi:hypothetical protein
MAAKYLGVILDAQLTWREHVDVIMRKARNMLWACGVRWGLRPRVVHWLYVSVIRSSITFTSLVWGPGCETARAKQQLSKIQRLACLGIMGAMRITPTNAVEAVVSPSTRLSGTGTGKGNCASPLESGKLVLPSSQSRA